MVVIVRARRQFLCINMIALNHDMLAMSQSAFIVREREVKSGSSLLAGYDVLPENPWLGYGLAGPIRYKWVKNALGNFLRSQGDPY